jgi:hypothetical protein
MEIRVVVPDVSRSYGLVRHLIGLFGGSSVLHDGKHHEVCVRSDCETSAVVQVIELVQSWLVTDGTGPVTLSVGDRSYVLGQPLIAAVPGHMK